MKRLLIGNVAERAGVSAPTIRYYESIGLLKVPPRSSTGYRHYTDTAVQELHFIKKAQGLGFSLDEIGEILKLTRAGKRRVRMFSTSRGITWRRWKNGFDS